MASSNSKQALLLAAVACLASLASATQWTVGDEGGWRARLNETAWTDGKTFTVGDTLLFVYPKEKHTVVKVGKDAFAACDLSANLQLGNWTSGSDVVTLDQPGMAWFICNKPTHCLNGMKLAIDVVGGTSGPAPMPFPGVPAVAPSPLVRFPFSDLAGPIPDLAALAPAPAPAASSPPSAAVRCPVGGAVAAAAAVVVAAALAL
ncbi:Uclacyanin 1 [Zea mays]|uniref:Uclacyanin 1 n=1 Tax=Zea mays TaxID=4577 RepID=A0A3L6E1L0_MAIZE|nr:Uclacyanin 1 [Zea mays]